MPSAGHQAKCRSEGSNVACEVWNGKSYPHGLVHDIKIVSKRTSRMTKLGMTVLPKMGNSILKADRANRNQDDNVMFVRFPVLNPEYQALGCSCSSRGTCPMSLAVMPRIDCQLNRGSFWACP